MGTGTSARFRLPENSRAPSDAFLKGKEPGCAGLGRLQPELDESPVMTAIGNQHPCLCHDSCARCAAPNSLTNENMSTEEKLRGREQQIVGFQRGRPRAGAPSSQPWPLLQGLIRTIRGFRPTWEPRGGSVTGLWGAVPPARVRWRALEVRHTDQTPR